MEAIQNLTQYNWFVVVSAIIVAMLAFKFLSDLFEWFVKKFGIETKSGREKRENKELLNKTSILANKTANNLNILQEQYEKNEIEFRNSLASHITESKQDRRTLHEEQKELTASINKLTDLFMDSEIDNMRSQILDFASSLSCGRKFNREAFDHILRIYKKYENILEENKMENGLVEESIKYIQESYHVALKSGEVK